MKYPFYYLNEATKCSPIKLMKNVFFFFSFLFFFFFFFPFWWARVRCPVNIGPYGGGCGTNFLENNFCTTHLHNFYTIQDTLVGPMYGETHMHGSHQCVLGCVREMLGYTLTSHSYLTLIYMDQ
jgi:hypothetical protein